MQQCPSELVFVSGWFLNCPTFHTQKSPVAYRSQKPLDKEDLGHTWVSEQQMCCGQAIVMVRDGFQRLRGRRVCPKSNH